MPDDGFRYTQGGVYEWSDPPPPMEPDPVPHGMNRPWSVVADQLAARPGKWALIVKGEPMDPISYRIDSGYGPFKPAGRFRTEVRRFDNGVFVWASMRTDRQYARWLTEQVEGGRSPRAEETRRRHP